jgi:hypothetical protein
MQIYLHDRPAVFQFVLKGKLAGAWVPNLEHAWDTARSVLGSKELVVDLSGISEADEPGVALLSRMRQSGAFLTAAHPPQSESFLASLGVTTPRPTQSRTRGWTLRFLRLCGTGHRF